jgi:DNA-binding NarL/FixJ family response regulator
VKPQATLEAAVRLVIADDDPAFRRLLRTVLGSLANVQIVGEATNGIEAVTAAVEQRADVLLLDVDMPRLGGFGAAEVIASLSPETRLLLHSGQASDEQRERAASLGAEFLDKFRLDETAAVIAGAIRPRADRHPRKIDPVVLLALAHDDAEAVIVVSVDRCVLFYNQAAATLVGLPFPARRLRVFRLWDLWPSFYPDGRPRPPEERPSARALAQRQPFADEVYACTPGGSLGRYLVTSLPFFGTAGEFVGIGNYVRPLPVGMSELRGRRWCDK